MATQGPFLVWTHSGGGANIVVMTDEQIAVGALPGPQLKTAEERLENGETILNVVGAKASFIHLASIQVVSADLNGTSVIIEQSRRDGSRKTDRLRFADRDAQADFMLEVRDRLPQNVEAGKTQSNRWLHALKPFNLFVVLTLATLGVQTLFDHELTDSHATRRKLDEWARQAGPADNSRGARAVRGATRTATVKALAHNPAVMRVLVIGMIIIGVLGVVLNSIGYIASMTIVGGGTGLCFCWVISRLCRPPQSILLMVPAKR
jgi:hypothetical protein